MTDYNKNIVEYINSLVKNHPRSYFKTLKSKSNSNILAYINENTPLLQDDRFLISTKVYWILNNLHDFPRCKICGSKIVKNVKINEGYPSHCSAKCLSMDPEVQKHKEESYEKRYGDGITNPFQSKEVIRKIDETNYRKYNVKRYTQSEEYRNLIKDNLTIINEKKYTTHKDNDSFNESKIESVVYGMLKMKFREVVRQYRNDKYQFDCDFYIPEIDTYIEYNGTWTHGNHPFDETNQEDLKIIEKWKNKNTEYYSNAIYTWTCLDVRKRKTAKDNGLTLVEMWNIDDVMDFLGMDYMNDLYYPYNRKKLQREFEYYLEKDETVLTPFVSHKNEIVKFFQQDVFFKKEKEIWKNNSNKKELLICNRLKYTGKTLEELTVDDILTGFKKSGIYYGYSHFNPMWFKWFITKYDSKICYDPCGGWGHRMLGASKLEKYIYNDFSRSTKCNVDSMIKYFGIENTVTYSEDARYFRPSEVFDSMFTCPPYFNVEHYECGDFKDITDFNNFIDSLFEVYHSREECKVFGIVLREDLLGKHVDYAEKIEINPDMKSYFDSSMNRYGEFMYIFKK